MENIKIKNKKKSTQKSLWKESGFDKIWKLIGTRFKNIVDKNPNKNWLISFSPILLQFASISLSDLDFKNISNEKKKKKILQKILKDDIILINKFLEKILSQNVDFSFNFIFAFIKFDQKHNGKVWEYYSSNDYPKQQVIESLFQESIKSLDDLLYDERYNDFDRLLRFCQKNLPNVYTKIEFYIFSSVDSDLTKFPEPSRNYILKRKKTKREKSNVFFETESQSISTGQLANLALSLWEVKDENNKTAEVFNSFAVYLNKYENLSFFGEIDKSIKYDSSMFFGNNISENEIVKVIKPGILWNKDGEIKVIFRSLVEKITNG